MAEKGLCIQFKFENEMDDFVYSDEASLYSWMLMKWSSPATVEIPEGVKSITSRTFGGMTQEYSQRRPLPAAASENGILILKIYILRQRGHTFFLQME